MTYLYQSNLTNQHQISLLTNSPTSLFYSYDQNELLSGEIPYMPFPNVMLNTEIFCS
jgi:hypothetical protein